MEKGEGGSMIERYEHPQIAEIWDQDEIYRRWHLVEVSHVHNVVGSTVANALRGVRHPSKAQVDHWERQTHHDVAAFLISLDHNIVAALKLSEQNGDMETVALLNAARASLHYGLTSSDVVDTAMAMGLQESAPVVLGRAEWLEKALLTFAGEFGNQRTIGRTHGQLAAPMLAKDRWIVLAEMVGRTITRVRTAFEWADVGKLSGPVGDLDMGEDSALASLGLRGATATQIVSRDRLAHLASTLALLVTVCEAIATQIWLLLQAGIDELWLNFADGFVGSSAMPHKRNPITAENIRGLARLARGYAADLQLSVIQWGEHDLAHSSVERVGVPDLLHLTCTALEKTVGLVSLCHPATPDDVAGYIDTSEELRTLQAEGVPYVDAHARLTALYRDGKITSTTTEETK